MNHCLSCGKQISRRARQCRPCFTRARWKRGGFDGVLHTPESRYKQSENAKARWARGDYDGLHNAKWRHKASEGLKKAHARGDFDAPETRHKASEGLKKAHARGCYDRVYGPDVQRKRSKSLKAAWARGDYDGIFQSPTSIELAIAAALDICAIEHISQYRPEGSRFTYDEFVPPNILVEVHGDYWHGPGKPRVKKRDAEKAMWAKDNDYYLVIIWEREIKEQGAWALVHERILPLIEGGK